MRGLFVMLIVALTSAAARADTPPGGADQPAANGQTQPIYRSIWKIEDAGRIAHLQSGLACDAAVSAFHRTNVIAFRPNGLDVGCNYATARNDITITEYITRRGTKTLADDLAEARSELLHRFDGLSLLADSKNFAPTGSWLKETYARDAGKFREGIWLADLNGWTLEYRVSYMPQTERVAFDGLAALWALAQATAGTQLARCAKTPATVRDGSPVLDKDQIEESLAIVSLLGAAAEDPQVQKPGQRPLTWCAEDELAGADVPMLLWHAVFEDGADASADRVTAMTVDETPALESAPDALMEIVKQANAKSPGRRPRWIVKLTRDRESAIYAMYDGRPPASELARLGEDVFTGKARSLGGYSFKDGKLNISLPAGK
jgi:hypothetical protein